MLVLQKIRWKNLLSYGEMWTEIELNRGPITVLTAANGNGKSTVLEAISVCLYGKPIRKSKKPNLVNRRNGRGALMECELTSNGDQYLIRRGIKPDVFEIYREGVLINQDSSSRDYQSFLEDKVLKMSFVIFTQTVLISKTLYTPFMQLNSQKRREFIEGILNLSVFSTMMTLHKQDESLLKSELIDITKQVTILSVKKEETEHNIESIKTILSQNTNEKIKEIDDSIKSKKDLTRALMLKHSNLKSGILDVNHEVFDKSKKMYSMLDKLTSKLSTTKSQLSKLMESDGKCTLCGNDMTLDHIELHKATYQNQIRDIEDGISKLKTKIELSDAVCAVEQNKIDVNNSLNVDIKHVTMQLKQYKKEIEKDINSKSLINVDTSHIDRDQLKLDSINDELDCKLNNQSELKVEVELSSIINSMLKDNGIKASIIDKSIPIINKIINQNVAKFGFFINFVLDKEFNETIKSRGIDTFEYHEFSEGEKLRIDMAILLAWREVAIIHSGISCNVLFLDEIMDASLDVDGTTMLSQMLLELKDTNVFIITHTPEKLDNISRSTIQFTKVDGYSKISH